MTEEQISSIMEAVSELLSDSTVPRNVKVKLENIIKALKEEGDISLKINRVLNDLDEITSDVNLQPYTRTQLWNIVSMLEKV